MLNSIRKIQSLSKPKYGLIEEQLQRLNPEEDREPSPELQHSDNPSVNPLPQPGVEQQYGQQGQQPQPSGGEQEGSDFAVINDVEVVIHSEDPEDLELNDEEKGNISQLIDDFRVEVVETVEFDKLHVYETSAKLAGKIGEIGLQFTLSTGDDTGLYINGQMLKIDEKSLDIFRKLGQYQLKFSSTINDLLVRRKTT